MTNIPEAVRGELSSPTQVVRLRDTGALDVMALLDDDSRCSLCGELLGDSANWIATTMVDLPPPLSRMDDSAAHHECLKNWELKRQFVDAYNSRLRKAELVVDEDGHVQYIRRQRPIIAWYEWILMPILLPLGIAYNSVAWLRTPSVESNTDR